ncbi:helix-turn-helix domain-containing protein [Chitinophaga sp. 22321]|uniref:AraC family transcriptional regulator n=1 Tax=Chitinophaga hostae TaxID=2831022 RepID=A0ABS5IYL7_9BACT|nr:helix-turn-helix domain-containing protein [Chitinophaga hostae]MBS0027943.1 AraC family transcriptional regulator [Chitinophaga hostae]
MALTGKHFDVQFPLSGIVKHFYVIQSTADDPAVVNHLSPSYEMMLIFNFGAPARISFAGDPFDTLQVARVGVVGPLRKMLNYEILPGSDIVVTVFNLDGFYRLFQLPVDELNGETVYHPDTFIHQRDYEELWEILNRSNVPEERIGLLSDYILTYMHDAEEAALPLLQGAEYFNDPLIQPAKAIAADADLSERSIQLRFKKYVGYSPKELLRFLRFKQVINYLMENPAAQIDWYDLIHDFGYHDQSHLIKDFRHFLGTTPEIFIKQIAGKEFCTTRPGQYYS